MNHSRQDCHKSYGSRKRNLEEREERVGLRTLLSRERRDRDEDVISDIVEVPRGALSS